MAERRANERTFGSWEAKPGGGRQYWYDVTGTTGCRARYVKEVDACENTTRFAQEIDAPTGELIEVHEKYPLDLGHRKVR